MVSSASFSSLSGVRQRCLGLYACLRKVSGRSIGAPPVSTFTLSIDEESSSSFFVLASLSLSLSLCVCLSFFFRFVEASVCRSMDETMPEG